MDAQQDPNRVTRTERVVEERTVPGEPRTTERTVVSESPAWSAARIIGAIVTLLEVLLVLRVLFRVFGANASQPIVNAIYNITNPLVAPFQGIFGQPSEVPGLEVAALLAIVFVFLIGMLIVSLVRASSRNSSEVERTRY